MTSVVILTIPRVAPVRPAAAPAIIKSILNGLGVSSRVLDINIEYFDDFKRNTDEKIYNEIDEFLFIKHKQLGAEAQQTLDRFIDQWIDKINQHNPEKVLSAFLVGKLKDSAKNFYDVLDRPTPLKS